MAAQKFFFRSLVPSSFASNSHFIKTFRPRKSSFLSFSKEKSVSQASCTGPREKIYLHAVIDRLDPGVDFQQHEMPQTNTYTPSLLCHLSLASFFCGYALHSPTMVHAGGSDEENNKSVYVNSVRYKGCFASKRRLSVMKNLGKASLKRSMEKQQETEEEEIVPPRKIVTRSKQVSSFLSAKHCYKTKGFAKLAVSLRVSNA